MKSTKKPAQAIKKPKFNPIFNNSIDYSTFDLSKLAETWIEYRQMNSELTFDVDKPKKLPAYTIDQYNKFLSDTEKYNNELYAFINHKEELKYHLSLLSRQIYQFIPNYNIWFLSDDNKFAVAIKAITESPSTWNILVEINPDIENLPELY